MARHSSDVLDAIYMPDCVSARQTPIAGENTASATMGAATRRTESRFSTNDRLRGERKCAPDDVPRRPAGLAEHGISRK